MSTASRNDHHLRLKVHLLDQEAQEDVAGPVEKEHHSEIKDNS
jgi:hypothetical protein